VALIHNRLFEPVIDDFSIFKSAKVNSKYMQNLLSKRQFVRRFKLTPATEMLILAVLIGILGGLGALLFKKLIFTLQDFFWRTPDMAPDSLLAVAWYRRLLLAHAWRRYCRAADLLFRPGGPRTRSPGSNDCRYHPQQHYSSGRCCG
jgi:hypothetical protein